jgi:hypothetical protein
MFKFIFFVHNGAGFSSAIDAAYEYYFHNYFGMLDDAYDRFYVQTLIKYYHVRLCLSQFFVYRIYECIFSGLGFWCSETV